MLCSHSTSKMRYSSLIFSGSRRRGSRQLCARNISVTYVYKTYPPWFKFSNKIGILTMDSSLIESKDKTVTWKYTIVGWPLSFGARFLSYSFVLIGRISRKDRLVSSNIYSALFAMVTLLVLQSTHNAAMLYLFNITLHFVQIICSGGDPTLKMYVAGFRDGTRAQL